MSVAAHVARGRARHLALMVDTVTITRPTGDRVYNPATQDYDQVMGTVYTGPARLKTWRGTDEPAAETEMNVQRYYVDLPLTAAAPDVARRDTLTVTASLNPALTGRVLIVTDVETETTDTALRCTCEFAS